MKPGQASKTAILVCMGRAIAHDDPASAGFSDPTALALLSDEAQARVAEVRTKKKRVGLKKAIGNGYLTRQASVMAARTLAIDAAVRAAKNPQLVILGAGLDGRAWRMKELAADDDDGVDVFEVDHPDSQREKRARLESAGLKQVARAVHFVPVDFARDSLDEALSAAGHDPQKPTTWIWEGVIMYLSQRDIDRTLAVVRRRSAATSQLVILYHRPASLLLPVVGFFLRFVGEPLRSSFLPPAMRALLEKFDFEVTRDESVPEIGRALSTELGIATKFAKHLRIVVAEHS